MSLNKYQNWLSNFLILIVSFLFIAGCQEENREEKIPEPKNLSKRLMVSPLHIISASPSEKMTYGIKKSNVSSAKLDSTAEKIFGINSIKKEGRQVVVVYNPAVISGDSIRSIIDKL